MSVGNMLSIEFGEVFLQCCVECLTIYSNVNYRQMFSTPCGMVTLVILWPAISVVMSAVFKSSGSSHCLIQLCAEIQSWTGRQLGASSCFWAYGDILPANRYQHAYNNRFFFYGHFLQWHGHFSMLLKNVGSLNARVLEMSHTHFSLCSCVSAAKAPLCLWLFVLIGASRSQDVQALVQKKGLAN